MGFYTPNKFEFFPNVSDGCWCICYILKELSLLLEVDSLFMEETRKLQKTPSKLPAISRRKIDRAPIEWRRKYFLVTNELVSELYFKEASLLNSLKILFIFRRDSHIISCFRRRLRSEESIVNMSTHCGGEFSFWRMTLFWNNSLKDQEIDSFLPKN